MATKLRWKQRVIDIWLKLFHSLEFAIFKNVTYSNDYDGNWELRKFDDLRCRQDIIWQIVLSKYEQNIIVSGVFIADLFKHFVIYVILYCGQKTW